MRLRYFRVLFKVSKIISSLSVMAMPTSEDCGRLSVPVVPRTPSLQDAKKS
jgi:hypothetical protein